MASRRYHTGSPGTGLRISTVSKPRPAQHDGDGFDNYGGRQGGMTHPSRLPCIGGTITATGASLPGRIFDGQNRRFTDPGRQFVGQAVHWHDENISRTYGLRQPATACAARPAGAPKSGAAMRLEQARLLWLSRRRRLRRRLANPFPATPDDHQRAIRQRALKLQRLGRRRSHPDFQIL